MSSNAQRGWDRPVVVYLSLVAGLLLKIQGVIELAGGGNSTLQTILEVVIVVLGIGLFVRAVGALRSRGNHHTIAR